MRETGEKREFLSDCWFVVTNCCSCVTFLLVINNDNNDTHKAVYLMYVCMYHLGEEKYICAYIYISLVMIYNC